MNVISIHNDANTLTSNMTANMSQYQLTLTMKSDHPRGC